MNSLCSRAHCSQCGEYVKKTDSPAITGYQIYHNYIREHEGLKGKTPAEACGIEIEGENKWITLIQNASKSEQ